MASNNSVRYPTELRERAVRMVLEGVREGYSSEWAAICAVAQMLGPTPETVRLWVRKAQAQVSADLRVSDQTIYNWRRQDPIDRGVQPGATSEEQAELWAACRRIVELEIELADQTGY